MHVTGTEEVPIRIGTHSATAESMITLAAEQWHSPEDFDDNTEFLRGQISVIMSISEWSVYVVPETPAAKAIYLRKADGDEVYDAIKELIAQHINKGAQ
jgi:hypothetical protein